MKYFLLTNRFNNTINVYEKNNDTYWYSSFHNDIFLIKTYDFDEFIFIIDENEIDLIEPYMNINKVRNIYINRPKNIRKILKELDADKNLMNKVYVL